MSECLSEKNNYEVRKYCMFSFVVTAYLYDRRQIEDYEMIIERKERKKDMNTYDLCRWLKGRNIKYKLSFRYNRDKSLKWNLKKYRNFLRLKVRLKNNDQ